mmetsp:Transcript_1861/g.1938  ORF Transcript_1861/g.1938 Transcript_1861/m.1938 type:complete len:266 (-) Transcript_1861:282-1079(-)
MEFAEAGKVAQKPTAVFVGNLAWSTTSDDLLRIMSELGPVVKADVKYFGVTNRSKGWGLVYFEDFDTAKHVVDRFDSTELHGRVIHVRLDRSHLDAMPGYSVYVGNLPWSVGDEKLLGLFSGYNSYDCHVMKNLSGRSRGFGLVKFANSADAIRAIENLNGKELDGRVIECRLSREHPPTDPTRQQNKVIIASNLSRALTDEQLKAHFQSCGEVLSAVVQRNRTRRSKGWGIVRYATGEEASMACERLNGSLLLSNTIEVRLDKK